MSTAAYVIIYEKNMHFKIYETIACLHDMKLLNNEHHMKQLQTLHIWKNCILCHI